MSINKRIQEIIDSRFFGNKRAFSFAIGVTASVTENIVGKRQGRPSFEVTYKIVNSIEGINSDWLLTGKGEMFGSNKKEEDSEDNNYVSEGESTYKNKSVNLEKPFIESVAAIQDGFTATIESGKCKHIVLPFVDDYDFSIRNYGDSMINKNNLKRSINDQDIVTCRFWKNKSHIRWGEVYALITPDGYIIKKIMPSEIANHIRCISFNEEMGYTPYDIPISEIMDWAIVTGNISINAW
ncbi:MAG: LexA family transcriptional regulator [Dysgonomonas sp.]|nr:LexA family transcriptional regulator [Dysgonomonas sp.]